MFAKANPGRDRDFCFFKQQFRKFERAQVAHGRRQRHPGKHRRWRGGDLPPGIAKGFDQHVAAALIGVANFVNTLLGPVQRRACRHLNGGESAIIEIGFDPRQSADQPLIAHRKAHAPAGHGIGFGQRGKFHRHVNRAFNLQDRGRRRVVKIDFRISKVRQDYQVVLARKGHDFAIKIQIGNQGGGVGRVVDNHRQRLGHRMAHRPVKRAHKGFARLRRQVADHATRHDETKLMDRISRVGRQNHIARRGDCLGDVGKAFLRSQGGDNLAVRVQVHTKAALIIGRLSTAQPRDAARGRIAVGFRLANRLDELVTNMLRRRHVGVAHAKVDNIDTARSRGGFQPVHLLKDIRRQTFDSMKFAAHRLAVSRVVEPATRAFPSLVPRWRALAKPLGAGPRNSTANWRAGCSSYLPPASGQLLLLSG